jgi:hypothetical protein
MGCYGVSTGRIAVVVLGAKISRTLCAGEISL